MGINFFELPPHMWVQQPAWTFLHLCDLKKLLIVTWSCRASLQLRLGRQRLPNHADGVRQSLHPHLRRERSGEDGGLQEDSAVLRCQLSEHHSSQHRQGQNAHVQPRPRGLMMIMLYHCNDKPESMSCFNTGVCVMWCFSCRLSATPKRWKMTTQVGLGSIWTFSLTAR